MVATVELEESVNELHITAARKLQELIQTVQEPQLLSRLIATALRFKLPKRPAPRAAPSPALSSSSTQTPRLSLTPSEDQAPVATSVPPEPPFLPEDSMPYRQYELLHKQLGGEGARRRQREYREQRRAERLARAAAPTPLPGAGRAFGSEANEGRKKTNAEGGDSADGG